MKALMAISFVLGVFCAIEASAECTTILIDGDPVTCCTYGTDIECI